MCDNIETMRCSFLYLCDYMNLDGEHVWSVAMDDFFSRISEERAFARSSGELEKNYIAELFIKITNPKYAYYFTCNVKLMNFQSISLFWKLSELERCKNEQNCVVFWCIRSNREDRPISYSHEHWDSYNCGTRKNVDW